MKVVGVDERDSSWEDHDPRFRVYLFDGGGPGASRATDTYDITGADVLEAIDWARDHAGDGLFSVALVWGDPDLLPENKARGLVWLVGHDANDHPTSETEQHLADRMHRRRADTP